MKMYFFNLLKFYNYTLEILKMNFFGTKMGINSDRIPDLR